MRIKYKKYLKKLVFFPFLIVFLELLLIFLLFIPSAFAQPKLSTSINSAYLDSLKQKLNQVKNTEKVNILNILSWELRNSTIEQARKYGEEAFQLSEKIRYSEGTAEALDNLSVISTNTSQYKKALKYGLQSLKIYKILRRPAKTAKVLNHIGTTQFRLGNYPEALDYLLQGKMIFEEIKDKTGTSWVLNNLGLVYQAQQNFNQAEESFQNALKISKELKNQRETASQLNNLGILFHQQKKYEQAINILQEALEIQKQLKDEKEIAHLYNNIGEVYESEGYYDQALDFFAQSIAIKEKIGDKEGLSASLNNLAKLNIKINQPQKALELASRSLKIAEEISAKSRIQDASLILADTYSSLQDFRSAYQYHQIYATMRDSLYNNEKSLLTARIQAEYEVNLKEKENKWLRKEKDALAENANNQQKRYARIQTATYILGGIAFLVCLVSIWMYWLVNERRKVNMELKEIINERNENLEYLNQELVRTNTELDNFLYKVSHDLKGPISTLEGLINLGMMDVKDEAALRYFDMEKKVITNTQLLIFRIVEIGDIRNHKFTPTTINMKKFTHRMIRSMRRAEEGGNVRFSMEVPDNLILQTDADMLEIAMDNIIKNAIQHAKYFNEDGQAFVKVVINELPDTQEISVIDNGHGISIDIADRIFDMFFKGNSHFKGFGLGLYKSKIAVEKIRGEITLSKSSSRETVFSIKIPKHYKPNGDIKEEELEEDI